MNPSDSLAKMVEGLDMASSVADLSTAVEGEQVWKVNKLMASVNKTNKKFTGAFREVASNIQRIDKNVEMNKKSINNTEKKILERVGGVVDSLQDDMITREDLEDAIEKSQLAKDVHFMERNLTVDERGQCVYSLIIHGIKEKEKEGEKREIPPETCHQVEMHLFSHLDLHGSVRIIEAHRLPKNRNSKKPAPIKIRLESPSQVHMVLENLYKLKDVAECKGVHVERDIPMMLSEERKKANSIVYQFRKVNGKNYIARVTYPRNKIHIAVKRKGEGEFKTLSNDEMETLYRDSKRQNWAEDEDEGGSRGHGNQRSSGQGQGQDRARDKKRQRSTPGEKSRAKSAKRASNALFSDDEEDEDSFHEVH